MAAFKYSMIFKYISGDPSIANQLNLSGGWSESVYWSTFNQTELANFRTLAQARALMLPARCAILGLRIQGVDPSSQATTYSVNYPGGAVYTQADIPQMALLLRVPSKTTNNVRSMRVAGIPDAAVAFGEFAPNAAFAGAVAVYFGYLGTWAMRATDLTQVAVPMVGIDSTGNVTMAANLAVAVGQKIKIKGIVDGDGDRVRGGVYSVMRVTDITHFQLAKWDSGTVNNGTATPFVLIYPTMNPTYPSSVSRVVPRKVGRPSLGYRGRRSKRTT